MIAMFRLTGLITLITPDVGFAMLSCDSMGSPPAFLRKAAVLLIETFSRTAEEAPTCGRDSSDYELYLILNPIEGFETMSNYIFRPFFLLRARSVF
jgi:hypothetical protein